MRNLGRGKRNFRKNIIRHNPKEFITNNSYKPREHGQCHDPSGGGYYSCGRHPWYGFETCCAGSLCIHCNNRTIDGQVKRQGGPAIKALNQNTFISKPHQKINTGINPYIPDVGDPNLNSRTNGSCPAGWVECPPMNHSDGCNLCHCNTGIQGWWPTCLEPPATTWDCNRWDTQGRWPIQFCNHECGDCSQVCAGWNAEHYYDNWHLYGGGECTTNWNACAYPPDSANWGGSCDSCEHLPNIPGGPDCNDGWCSAECECPVHPEYGSFGTYPYCVEPTPNCCNGGIQCGNQESTCCNESGFFYSQGQWRDCATPTGGYVAPCECFDANRYVNYQTKTHRKGGQICPDGSTRIDAFGNNVC